MDIFKTVLTFVGVGIVAILVALMVIFFNYESIVKQQQADIETALSIITESK